MPGSAVLHIWRAGCAARCIIRGSPRAVALAAVGVLCCTACRRRKGAGPIATVVCCACRGGELLLCCRQVVSTACPRHQLYVAAMPPLQLAFWVSASTLTQTMLWQCMVLGSVQRGGCVHLPWVTLQSACPPFQHCRAAWLDMYVVLHKPQR
jgi:hypothetical protein